MIGFSDEMILVALQRGWQSYGPSANSRDGDVVLLDNRVAFSTIFPGFSDERLRRMYDQLQGKPPMFGRGRMPNLLSNDDPSAVRGPMILVELGEENPTEEVFGHVLGEDEDGFEVLGYRAEQRVDITILADTALECTTLYGLVRGIMLHSLKALARNGYESVTFAGGGRLELYEETIATHHGLHGRRQSWRTTTHVAVPELDQAEYIPLTFNLPKTTTQE